MSEDLISIANELLAKPNWKSIDLYHALLRAFRLGEDCQRKLAEIQKENPRR